MPVAGLPTAVGRPAAYPGNDASCTADRKPLLRPRASRATTSRTSPTPRANSSAGRSEIGTDAPLPGGRTRRPRLGETTHRARERAVLLANRAVSAVAARPREHAARRLPIEIVRQLVRDRAARGVDRQLQRARPRVVHRERRIGQATRAERDVESDDGQRRKHLLHVAQPVAQLAQIIRTPRRGHRRARTSPNASPNSAREIRDVGTGDCRRTTARSWLYGRSATALGEHGERVRAHEPYRRRPARIDCSDERFLIRRRDASRADCRAASRRPARSSDAAHRSPRDARRSAGPGAATWRARGLRCGDAVERVQRGDDAGNRLHRFGAKRRASGVIAGCSTRNVRLARRSSERAHHVAAANPRGRTRSRARSSVASARSRTSAATSLAMSGADAAIVPLLASIM